MANLHKNKQFRILLPALILLSGMILQGWSQEYRFQVIDHVDLPEVLGGGQGSTVYLEFREIWVVLPDRPSMIRETSEYILRDTRDSTASSHYLTGEIIDLPGETTNLPGENTDLPGDSDDIRLDSDDLLMEFGERVRMLLATKDRVEIDGIRHELNLLDPHLVGPGTEGFQVPDSMDSATRELQEAFITLLKPRTAGSDRYDWEQEMLSVEFLEQWSIDPATLKITRTVKSITPVIWNRRQTVEGVPVDEAGTGYPVYYKNSTRPVPLRNP